MKQVLYLKKDHPFNLIEKLSKTKITLKKEAGLALLACGEIELSNSMKQELETILSERRETPSFRDGEKSYKVATARGDKYVVVVWLFGCSALHMFGGEGVRLFWNYLSPVLTLSLAGVVVLVPFFYKNLRKIPPELPVVDENQIKALECAFLGLTVGDEFKVLGDNDGNEGFHD